MATKKTVTQVKAKRPTIKELQVQLAEATAASEAKTLVAEKLAKDVLSLQEDVSSVKEVNRARMEIMDEQLDNIKALENKLKDKDLEIQELKNSLFVQEGLVKYWYDRRGLFYRAVEMFK